MAAVAVVAVVSMMEAGRGRGVAAGGWAFRVLVEPQHLQARAHWVSHTRCVLVPH